jgi:hypothetical protein
LLSAAEASLFTLYFPAGLSKTYRVMANSQKPMLIPAGLYANFTFHSFHFPADLSKTYRVLANSQKPTQNPAGLYDNFTFHFSLFTFHFSLMVGFETQALRLYYSFLLYSL